MAATSRRIERVTRWCAVLLGAAVVIGLAVREVVPPTWWIAGAVWAVVVAWLAGWSAGRLARRVGGAETVTQARRELGEILDGATTHDVRHLITTGRVAIGGDVVVASAEDGGIVVGRMPIPVEWLEQGYWDPTVPFGT